MGNYKGDTVDDFSIKVSLYGKPDPFTFSKVNGLYQNAASQLDKLINRWASDVIRNPPAPTQEVCAAILTDIISGFDAGNVNATAMQLQSYLRHAMAETISEGIINCLIVTNSTEANIQLTRIHEHIFARKLLLLLQVRSSFLTMRPR
jgi:hypothetical protein